MVEMVEITEAISDSPFPSDQLTFSNGDNQRVNSCVGERSINHWPPSCFMIDGVVGNKQASGHHVRLS
jgi:hypothetical protein